MKKALSGILVCVLLVSLLCLSGCGKKKALTIYTWADMFPEEILTGFTKETGIEINYVNFDTDETMLAKLEAANGGDYDIVIADDYILETAIGEGLVQKLDKSKIKNFGNLDDRFMHEYYDPEGEYTVPYGAGIMEIAYSPERVGKEITGYAGLWDPELKDRVGIIANPRVILGMALNKLGYSLNSTSEAEIREAGELLNSLAPNIRLVKDSYINDDLVSGEIDAAYCYTSNATLAKLTDPTLSIVLPEEGLGYGVMGMFVPSKAPNADAAYRFIDYICEAHNAAVCFEYLGYYCTNKAANEFISEEMLPMVTLPEELSGSWEIVENIPGEIYDIYEDVWNQFKILCE